MGKLNYIELAEAFESAEKIEAQDDTTAVAPYVRRRGKRPVADSVVETPAAEQQQAEQSGLTAPKQKTPHDDRKETEAIKDLILGEAFTAVRLATRNAQALPQAQAAIVDALPVADKKQQKRLKSWARGLRIQLNADEIAPGQQG